MAQDNAYLKFNRYNYLNFFGINSVQGNPIPKAVRLKYFST